MKLAIIILTVVTGLLIFSTVVCGLWIRSQQNVDASSISFHANIALITVLFTVVTLGLAVARALQVPA